MLKKGRGQNPRRKNHRRRKGGHSSKPGKERNKGSKEKSPAKGGERENRHRAYVENLGPIMGGGANYRTEEVK